MPAPSPVPQVTAAQAAAEMATGFVAALRLPDADPARHAAALDTAHRLLERWDEPHRRYHTVAHLTATLEAARVLLAPGNGGPADPPVSPGPADPADSADVADVELAVWFHDAVYRGEPVRDEEASAELAVTELTMLGVPVARAAEIGRLVRLTATHHPAPDDAAGQLLCDADLAVLAAPDPVYRAYARAVRQEYAHVPEGVFRTGRSAVLTVLSAAPSLFRTHRARQLWETTARANLAAELARLADPDQPLDGDDLTSAPGPAPG